MKKLEGAKEKVEISENTLRETEEKMKNKE